MPEQITEAIGAILEAAPDSRKTGRYKVLVINEGVGSSGRYPKATLQEAAKAKVIPKGTQSFIDHQGAGEERDRARVGRSVRDLAGVLTEDAYWDETNNGLVATMQVYGPYRDLLAEMHGDIGLSIKGSGEMRINEAGEREISSLTEVRSVDWVTKAGRGGKVLELLESAIPGDVNARAVSHGIAEATVNDTREQLQAALRTAHTGFRYLYVRDFDDSRVWFEGTVRTDGGDAVLTSEATYQQSYTSDGGNVSLTGSLVEVRQVITYVPVVSATEARDSTHTNTPKEGLVPELTEAEVTALRDSAAQAEAARDAALAEAVTAKTALAEATARQSARPAVAAKVAESKTLGARTQARLVESIVAQVPVVDGVIADDTLTAAVEAAVTAAEAEVADYQPARPAGFSGVLGSVIESATAGAGGAQLVESDVLKSIRSGFGKEA